MARLAEENRIDYYRSVGQDYHITPVSTRRTGMTDTLRDMLVEANKTEFILKDNGGVGEGRPWLENCSRGFYAQSTELLIPRL